MQQQQARFGAFPDFDAHLCQGCRDQLWVTKIIFSYNAISLLVPHPDGEWVAFITVQWKARKIQKSSIFKTISIWQPCFRYHQPIVTFKVTPPTPPPPPPTTTDAVFTPSRAAPLQKWFEW
jgi:hypothetical protein